MTGSRAALEEAARQKRYALVNLARAAIQRKVVGLENAASFDDEQLADFAEDYAEQESSSLKLLLRAIFRDRVRINSAYGSFPARIMAMVTPSYWDEFPVELDSSGIPVLTPEIVEALKNAK